MSELTGIAVKFDAQTLAQFTDDAEVLADAMNELLGLRYPGVDFVEAWEIGTEKARTPGTVDVSDQIDYESILDLTPGKLAEEVIR